MGGLTQRNSSTSRTATSATSTSSRFSARQIRRTHGLSRQRAMAMLPAAKAVRAVSEPPPASSVTRALRSSKRECR